MYWQTVKTESFIIVLKSHFLFLATHQMSRRMEKPTICIGENKGADQLRSYADQLRSNCEADQRL